MYSYVSPDAIELARMLYHDTLVSCDPVQFFGLTTANQLAPALPHLCACGHLLHLVNFTCCCVLCALLFCAYEHYCFIYCMPCTAACLLLVATVCCHVFVLLIYCVLCITAVLSVSPTALCDN